MPEPPALPPENDDSKDETALDRYNTIAETVGGMPSLRMKDNLVQGLVVFVTTGIGAAVSWFVYGDWGAPTVLFAVLGMIVGLLGSGIVLMVLGWIRAAKK